MASCKLNLGCGDRVVDGWINVDYALGARFARIWLFSRINRRLKFFRQDWDPRIRIHDLRRRFPFKDDSVDVIYSSHTLEHFTKNEGRRFLRECYRVLKPGGIVRVVVPDLETFVHQYLDGIIPAVDFVERLYMLPGSPDSGGLREYFRPLIDYPHKCMYDAKSLLKGMTEAGFKPEQRKPFDSEIEDIDQIELENRTRDAVIVEAAKTPPSHRSTPLPEEPGTDKDLE